MIITTKPQEMGWKTILIYYCIYIGGICAFLLMIADPFSMSTYFSDNSLLPGLANREFSLSTEAEYYLKDLEKLRKQSNGDSFFDMPKITEFIHNELENFGLEVLRQDFSFLENDQSKHKNGTNIYSIIRGERSTNSEAITLCVPLKMESQRNTLPSIALTMAMAKYFSTRSYWAKDVIILFVDHYDKGTSAWLDSYHDINYRDYHNGKNTILPYDTLQDRSGPMQAAIVLEMYGKEFTKVNVKIHGLYGQLPNLDLFNLVIELAARESITPFFHDKSLPFDLPPQELYIHHLETTISFMKTQATMKSDGLHGLFLQYSIQSLTLDAPEYQKTSSGSFVMASNLLNMGRLIEGIFRSLNNLTERFNRSYYFYIILSLRRFTSIGYYMSAFGIIIFPVLLKALHIHLVRTKQKKRIGSRCIILLSSALILSLISTFNISTALFSAVVSVPILLLI